MALSLPCTVKASESRVITNFDAQWKFHLGDVPAASNPSFNDNSWRTLDLPHDWSIEGENLENAPGGGSIGYFPTGIGWYRKHFDLPSFAKGRMVSIEFDGVYMNSEVWINGHYLGRYPYGYSSFFYDLTPYLRKKGNIIAVKVDNSKQPNSRWYTGSGIYRHVKLVETSGLHFKQWGVFAYTENIADGKAVLKVESEIVNDMPDKFDTASVRNILFDDSGKEVARQDSDLKKADTKSLLSQCTMTVDNPRLWNLDSPVMYKLKSFIYADGKEVDCVETNVGLRTIEYDINKGFMLNGQSVKMKGVNLHHDGGAVGAAVPERVWERRLEILKSGGCNAVRTSHNIPAPEFLDLCDKLGILVMDEAFDCWLEGKRDFDYHIYFADWYEKDLNCMLTRDRNHPSVVMWSIGNEVPDQSSAEGPMLARKMIKMCHQLDPTRLVTSGNDRIAADDTPASEEFLSEFQNDIVGYNYPDRWRKRRETMYTTDKIRFPERRVVATESGGLSGSRGMSAMPHNRRFIQSSTISDRFIDTEQRWKYTIVNDFVIGDFMWTGIDYYGETWWPSRGSGSGYLDNCGFKKDGYYFFKSIWTDEPTLHIVPNWNQPKENIGKVMQVLVFTNCSEVELFVNGKSYGKKTFEFPRKGNEGSWASFPKGKVMTSTADLHLSWDVAYEPGEVVAVGTKDGKQYTERVVTTGDPASIRLSVDRDVIFDRPSDVAHITAEVVDKDGNVVPDAENLIKFNVGTARIIGVESGNMADLSSTKSSQRKAYGGMCLAIVQADKAGNYTVTATSEGLKSGEVSFKAVE